MRLWGKRIMTVDDDRDTLDFIGEVLHRAGAEAICVGAAAYALPSVVFLMPDLLIVDVAMPGQDGVSLVRELRTMPADQGGRVPAITLSAMPPTPAALAEWEGAGFQRHLSKPFDPEELVRVAGELIGQKVERRRVDLPPTQWPPEVAADRRQGSGDYQRGREASSDSALSRERGRAK